MKFDKLRKILNMAAESMLLKQFDVKMEFLHSNVEEIYVNQLDS